MAFTRQALKARAKLRKENSKCGYREVLLQGERAFRSGETNPYQPGTEDHSVWQDGWADARDFSVPLIDRE